MGPLNGINFEQIIDYRLSMQLSIIEVCVKIDEILVVGIPLPYGIYTSWMCPFNGINFEQIIDYRLSIIDVIISKFAS